MSVEREPAAMSVRGAAVWAMGAQYVGFAMQFATSVIISRFFLDPAEVGLFSIALAAALLVAVLQDFGLSRYIAGLSVIDGAEVERCSTVALLFSLVVAGIIAAAAWPMAALYDQPALTPILLIIAASYLALPLAVVPLAMMARAMQFRGHAIVTVGGTLAQCGVGIALAWAGWSSFALAWATLAAGLARGGIAQALRPSPPWPLRFDSVLAVLSFGSRSSVLYLTGGLGTRSPDLIVGKILSLTAVGLYSRAVGLSDQFRQLIAGAMGSVFYPAFARIRDRGEPLGPAYLRVCAGYSAIIWPGMAGLALAAEPLVRVLYGPEWLGVAPLLSMIALTEILLIALPLVSELPIVLGRLNSLLAYNIADTILSVTLLALGCLWGVEGAAASRLMYGAVWLCLYWRFFHGLVRFDVGALARIYARSAAATGAAVAPLAITYLVWDGPARLGFGPLLVAVGLGVLAWMGTLVVLRHPAVGEITTMARQLPLVRRRWRPAL